MFLAKQRKKKPEGGYWTAWVLRDSYWDREEKRIKQRYIAYVGKKQTITESQARELACKVAVKLGITEEEAWQKLRRVKRLRIVPDEEPEGGVLTLAQHRKRVAP